MTPEECDHHRERVLYLSEHPMLDRDAEDADLERERRQTTFEVFAR